ncbi:RRQRL motif-containing zinc-binding protein [Streptomyces sp. NPDC091027]|uniref:RRQRL motif-containing zinc-binding protein n=1 Tax=Streptomyces sp. NPDC091027 TaxID=3365971 RepID=UPI00382A2104
MADQDEDLVDVDPYDPGDGSLPVFRWKQAGRKELATRRQLREMGLRPGGAEPVARIECRGGKRWAWLYRIDLAKPKFPMTLAKEAALDKAMAARQTCPGPCGRRYLPSLEGLGVLPGVLRRNARRPRLLHRSSGAGSPARRLNREDHHP